MINEFDSDGDELLDLRDSEKLMKQEESEEVEDVLGIAFDMFEVDECAAMIRPFDLDDNGFLDFHEFLSQLSLLCFASSLSSNNV